MKNIAKIIVAAGLLLVAVSTASAGDISGLWRITFDTKWLGPMETHVNITRDANGIRGVSTSGSVAVISQLRGDHNVDSGLMVFAAGRAEGQSYTGKFLAPWEEGELQLTLEGDTLSGAVEGGAFTGSVFGERVDQTGTIRDYIAVLQEFDDVVASKVFSPGDLQKPGYLEFRETFGRIAATATDDLDILFGFHLSWKNEPFSHFEFKRSHQSAEEMFGFFDHYRVGFEAATVKFDGDTAILKVRTMMGADTIEQIEAAYERIAEQGSKMLIIDLRENSGGAFAVKPLVEHVIDEPLDAGFFLSQVWNRDHDQAPTSAEVMAAPIWRGWSIISFWKDVQERDILRVQFQPAEPNFDGDVFVLLDENSASATELAADAFRVSGLATLVGRKSAGQMLSQSMFDVGEKFVVSLPVADYYSIRHGRIEGQGVPVDVESDPAEALDVAQSLPNSHSN